MMITCFSTKFENTAIFNKTKQRNLQYRFASLHYWWVLDLTKERLMGHKIKDGTLTNASNLIRMKMKELKIN